MRCKTCGVEGGGGMLPGNDIPCPTCNRGDHPRGTGLATLQRRVMARRAARRWIMAGMPADGLTDQVREGVASLVDTDPRTARIAMQVETAAGVRPITPPPLVAKSGCFKPCPECDGRGVVPQGNGLRSVCRRCGGTGWLRARSLGPDDGGAGDSTP